MKILTVGIIYKITYPNGKIYIGQDRTDDCNYFGSADAFTISKDFTQKQRDDFTIRKQVLCRFKNISIYDLNKKEREYIKRFRSDDPEVGYNRNGVARRYCRTLWRSNESRIDS